MRIDSIRLLHVARPLVVPESFGNAELTRRESVLVELRSGRHSGWAQADPGTAPAATGQWAAASLLCLKDWLAPQLVGQDLTSGESLQRQIGHVAGNPAAKVGSTSPGGVWPRPSARSRSNRSSERLRRT